MALLASGCSRSLLLFMENNPDTSWDLWVLPLDGNRKPVPYIRTEFSEAMGQFSPDDRWVVYTSDESGQNEIYVQPYPADGSKWQISTGGGLQPRWSADGKELFYLTPDGRNSLGPGDFSGGNTFDVVPRT